MGQAGTLSSGASKSFMLLGKKMGPQGPVVIHPVLSFALQILFSFMTAGRMQAVLANTSACVCINLRNNGEEERQSEQRLCFHA